MLVRHDRSYFHACDLLRLVVVTELSFEGGGGCIRLVVDLGSESGFDQWTNSRYHHYLEVLRDWRVQLLGQDITKMGFASCSRQRVNFMM